MRKTGGTTLLTLLENNFHRDSILNSWDWEQLIDNMPNDFAKYRLIHGHFGYRFYQLLLKKPLFMTMLRDPLSQSISNFNDYKREPMDVEVKKFYANKTIDEAVTHPLERFLYLNPQVRDIANDRLNPYWHPVRDVPNERLNPYWKSDKRQSTADDIYEGRTETEILEIAKARIKEFAFIGLVEHYQESLFLLAFTFGWTPARNIIPKNTANDTGIKREQIGEDTIKRIQELTLLDSQLYDYGKEIFEERYNAMINELRANYYRPSFEKLSELDAVYEMLQLWYSDVYQRKYSAVSNVRVNFNDVLLGWGWHGRENATATGSAFRWTGPETQSIIDLPLKRDHDLRIVIRVIGWVTEEILKSFSLKVDGYTNPVPLSMEQIQSNIEGITFSGIIPSNSAESRYSFTRLVLEVDKTAEPRSVNPDSTDNRRLGLAISEIEISPQV